MFQHRISEVDVRAALAAEDVIEESDVDPPFFKRIYFDVVDSRPIHVVVEDDEASQETTVITVYEPDLDRWNLDSGREENYEMHNLPPR